MRDYNDRSREEEKAALIAELRKLFAEIAGVVSRHDPDSRQKRRRLEDIADHLRSRLQVVMGETEADRAILDMREEILGEKYD